MCPLGRFYDTKYYLEEDSVEVSIMESKQKHVSATNEDAVINYNGVKAMPLIIGNETFEKLGTIGTLSNLMVYLTTVFNMKSITAATLINFFSGTTNIAPLVGAFLSDTYFGRYKTLGFASVSSLLGMMAITLTAAVTKLHPPRCEQAGKCIEPTAWQMSFLLTAFGFLIIGAGGIRPCNLAFGADQFNPTTESGNKGIASFFNWYYFTFTFAMTFSVTLIVYIQSNISWTLGLSIPTGLMFLSCALFFLGSSIYVKVNPQGSPLTNIAQVLVAATKKRHLNLPEHHLSLFNHISANYLNTKLPHTDQFTCLDKAAIMTPDDEMDSNDSPTNPWRLCSLQQVEEAKCVIRIIPIWASAIVFHVALNQQHTYAVFQALQSDRRISSKTNFQVPAASYIVFAMLSLTLWIPIYDQIIVPSIRKLTKTQNGITLLQRMGIGLVLSILTMIVSGLVEQHRRNLALTRPTLGISPKGGAISSMSGYWLVPQLTLSGLCEAFNAIGQIEFYYSQFPENMRSIAGSWFFFGAALSSYLSGFLVSFVHHVTLRSRAGGDWLPEDLNEGRLDWFYYLIAGLGVVNFGYFLVCAKWYRYKGVSGENAIELSGEVIKPVKHFV